MSEEPYEPTQEDIDFLNDIVGVIGINKPHVIVIKDDEAWYREWELEIIDGDHLRIDEQPFDDED